MKPIHLTKTLDTSSYGRLMRCLIETSAPTDQLWHYEGCQITTENCQANTGNRCLVAFRGGSISSPIGLVYTELNEWLFYPKGWSNMGARQCLNRLLERYNARIAKSPGGNWVVEHEGRYYEVREGESFFAVLDAVNCWKRNPNPFGYETL